MGRKVVQLRPRRKDLEAIPHYVVHDTDTGEVIHITKSFKRAVKMVLTHDNWDYFVDKDNLMAMLEDM